MNKKEISEIKRFFCNERCNILRICGCYVDGEKNKIFESKEPFLSLSEEAIFKYYEIFKKTLSGTIGKNLINMEFPLEQEQEGGTQDFLLRLRNSHLQDDALVDEFFQKIIDTYQYPENYYIILIDGAYDIPQKTTDGIMMDDASEYVFEYMLACICPVRLSKAGLSYNAATNSIEDRVRDWIVETPDVGFLFPAYNDRNTDIHSLLYYSKDVDLSHVEITENVLGVQIPLPAKSQKASFTAVIEDTLGTECSLDVVKTISSNIKDMVAEQKSEPEPLSFDKGEVKQLLMRSGVSDEQLEHFEERYDQTVGKNEILMAHNIQSPRTFEIKTPNITIKVNPEHTDLIEQRIVDGIPSLVIAITDEVLVNGVRVKSRIDQPSEAHNPSDLQA